MLSSRDDGPCRSVMPRLLEPSRWRRPESTAGAPPGAKDTSDVLAAPDALGAPQADEEVLDPRGLGTAREAGYGLRHGEPRLVPDATRSEGLHRTLRGLDERVRLRELGRNGTQEAVLETVIEGMDRDGVSLPIREVREPVRHHA